MVSGAVLESGKKVLSSKWTWIILAIFVILLMSPRIILYIKKLFVAPDVTDAGDKITPERESELTILAGQLGSDLDHLLLLSTPQSVIDASMLTDVELLHVANHYKTYDSRKGKSLYNDVHNTVFVSWSDASVKLESRLKKLNQL